MGDFMIDVLATVTVALGMFGIMSMVLAPATTPRSVHGIRRRPTLTQWLAKYFKARTGRVTPWWAGPYYGL